MASINRLAIRGVRSFSPNDEEQAVEFFFPCTIIVGANGCGKTTIIESLKYAMTGAFPPGNKSGQAFVHDPRSIGSQLVKAQVKLRFTSRGGNQMVVVRSMELTQKKTTISFKQLDGALRTLDTATNKIVSLSHKCSELDRQLPQLLGVSKPILEHVLFCHQEDASWPLQEGAVLKKRFDDIFDSTRYTKAIDVFRKTEKDLLAKVKDLKADLAGLSSHRHAAHGFQKELSRHQEQLDQLDDEKKQLLEDIKDAEKAQAEADEIIDQVEEVTTRIEAATAQHAAKLEMVQKQKEMLGKEQDMTKDHPNTESLQKMLREYNQQVESQSDELESLRSQEANLEKSIQKLRDKERALAGRKARLETAREHQQQRCKERYAKMEHMAQTYSFNLQLSSQQANVSFDGSFVASQNTTFTGVAGSTDSTNPEIGKEEMLSFLKVVDDKEKELQEAYQDSKVRHQAEEDKLVAALSDLEGRRKSVQNERQKLAEQREKASAEQRELVRQMDGHGRVRKTDIEDTRRQATRLAKERDQANSDPRRTQIPVEIRSLEEKIDSTKREIEDDRMVLESLRHCAENLSAITMLQEQCEKDVEALEETYRDQSFLLQKHNLKPDEAIPSSDDDPDGHKLVSFVESIFDKVREKFETVKSDLSKAEDDVAKTQRSCNERSAVLSSQQQSLHTVTTRLEQLEGEQGSVVQAQKMVEALRIHEAGIGLSPPSKDAPPQDLLTYINSRLSEIEEDAPADDAEFARKLLKKLERLAKRPDDSPQGFSLVCPCCDRGMAGDEVRNFKTKMDSLKKDSSLVKTADADVAVYNNLKARYEEWRQFLNEKMEDLRDYRRFREEKLKLEISLEQQNDDLATFQATLTGHKDNAKTIQAELDELKDLLDACKRLSGEASRISEKRMQIDQKKQDMTLDTAYADRDLRTVEREIADKMEEKDGFMNKINRLNKEMTALNNRITQLSTQAANMDKIVRERETKFAAAQKNDERKAELAEQLSKMQEEDAKLQEQLAPLKRKIETKQRDKERARALRDSEVSSLHNKLIEFQSEAKELRQLTKAIDDFAATEVSGDFDRISAETSEVLEQISSKDQELKSLRADLSKLQDTVQNQERYKKMIRDNIDVIETQNAAEELNKEIERLQEQKRSVKGSDTAYDEHKKAVALKQKRQGELARLEGRFMEVVEAVRSLKRKLSSEEYKDVDEQYRIANIKFHTTQLAAEDLKKYWNAVDKALLKYHSVKIGEINKIVRELWLLTYKGEDIGNIEIVSGEEPGSRSSRSYNYRVVMTKGNSQLDMRGRCSAGQRVLASIVIRLALAETFGVNCGCIALDEPTVNLDYPNKKGLAVALAQIIAARSQQSNFQLVLITHDEEFVSMTKTEMSMLTGFSMPEKYFQVRRERASDGKFYSKIDEKDWSEL
ncbi:hypothetical protein ACA910_012772 [Epithemia clementina (nom. ined.)]